MAGKKWELLGFMAAVRQWMLDDEPPGDLLVKVAGFGGELERDPETGAEQEHANLFFQVVPGTEHDGWIVSITYSLHKPSSGRFSGEVACQTVTCVRHPQRELLAQYPPPLHHRAAK